MIKRIRSAFASVQFGHRLRTAGLTQIILIGTATSAGVETMARQTYELGFSIMLATDATTDRRKKA